MRAATARFAVVFVALFPVTSCELEPTAPSLDRPSASLVDASRGGTAGFYWLPPIASGASAARANDPSLLVHLTVLVCELNGNACGATIASYSATGTGRDQLRVTEGAVGHYGAEWKTDRGSSAEATYRVAVLLAGTPLGHADVKVATNAAALRTLDRNEYVGVVAGQTLPIRFRILPGAVGVLDSGGGTLELAEDRVTLVVPAGALAGPVGIAVAPLSSYPSTPDNTVVPGTVYDFAPDGTTFDPPALLTVRYDETSIPAGASESQLRLMHLVDGAWQEVPGSTVNTTENSVSGSIEGFSAYGVVIRSSSSGPDVLTVWGSGTAFIDGTIAAGEWDDAAVRAVSINVPGGGSTPGTFYLMSDDTHLHVALKFARSTLDFGTHLNFTNGLTDQFHMSVLNPPGNTIDAEFFDAFFDTSDPNCMGCTLLLDTAHAGTNDGEGAYTHDGSHVTIEMTHPLNSLDAHDLSTSPGHVIDFDLLVQLHDGVVTSPHIVTSILAPTERGEFVLGPVLSGSGTPTVDGDLSDWVSADCVDVPVQVPEGGTTPGRVCAMNDVTDLFLAIEYARGGIDAGIIASFGLDQNASGEFDAGDDFIHYVANPAFIGFPVPFFDFFVSTCNGQPCVFDDLTAGGQKNGTGAYTFDGTHGRFEMSHPLASGDLLDVALAADSLIGVKLFVDLQDGVQAAATSFPATGLLHILVK